MSSKRVFFIMLGVLGLLGILTIGGFAFGNVMLQKEAAKLVDLKLQNRVLDEEQAALLQANKDIQKYAELEKVAKSIVPQDKDQAKSVREIIQLASESQVPIASIAFPPSNLGQAAPKTTTPNSTATPTTPAAPTLSQVQAVEGIPGVYRLEVQVQSDNARPITFANLVTFLSKLEQNRRTAQVSQITIQPTPSDIRFLNFQLTMNVYIKP
jgi:hypothetical protein